MSTYLCKDLEEKVKLVVEEFITNSDYSQDVSIKINKEMNKFIRSVSKLCCSDGKQPIADPVERNQVIKYAINTAQDAPLNLTNEFEKESQKFDPSCDTDARPKDLKTSPDESKLTETELTLKIIIGSEPKSDSNENILSKQSTLPTVKRSRGRPRKSSNERKPKKPKVKKKPIGDRKQRKIITKEFFLCDQCGKSFKRKLHLNYHQAMHTGKTDYQCEVCEKYFLHNQDLRNHKLIHTGEKPFKCDLCEATFNRNCLLKDHVAAHDKNNKSFVCEHCGKGFSIKKALKTHLRIHTGEKPYKCQQCNKAFVQSTHLKTHMSIHTGAMPYSCPVCGDRFRFYASLNKHKLIHKPEVTTPNTANDNQVTVESLSATEDSMGDCMPPDFEFEIVLPEQLLAEQLNDYFNNEVLL